MGVFTRIWFDKNLNFSFFFHFLQNNQISPKKCAKNKINTKVVKNRTERNPANWRKPEYHPKAKRRWTNPLYHYQTNVSSLKYNSCKFSWANIFTWCTVISLNVIYVQSWCSIYRNSGISNRKFTFFKCSMKKIKPKKITKKSKKKFKNSSKNGQKISKKKSKTS